MSGSATGAARPSPIGAPGGDLHAAALRRDDRRERLALFGLALPALLLVTVTMALPTAWLFWLSLLADDGTLSLVNYARMIEQPSYGRTFLTTFEVGFLTTGLCILIGYPLAYTLSQLPQRTANLCMIAVLLPFWTSLLVRTYAWLVLLQRTGLINSWGMALGLWTEPLPLVHNLAGTLIGMVHVLLPYLVLPLYGAMRAIDRDLIRAASNLGASPAQAFRTVFLPLSLPGLAAGALIVFILCLGFYVTPVILGGGKVTMVSNRIADDIDVFFNWGAASALGVVLLVLTLSLLWLTGRLARGVNLFGGGHV